MAAQDHKSLYVYRINAIVGKGVHLLHAHGWNDDDALDRIGRRLQAEGHHHYTLAVLDRKELH